VSIIVDQRPMKKEHGKSRRKEKMLPERNSTEKPRTRVSKMAESLIEKGGAMAQPLPPDEMASAAAGGLAGAAIVGSIGAAALSGGASSVAKATGAAVGAIAGALVSRNMPGDGDVWGDSVDEVGAFYGMLQIQLRAHAPLRAAYSAAMVWVTLIFTEVIVSGTKWVRRKMSGNSGKTPTALKLIDRMTDRAGLSFSLRGLYARALERYDKEFKMCGEDIGNACRDRVITRGTVDLGLGGAAESGKYQTKWKCSLRPDTNPDKAKRQNGNICMPPENWFESLQNDMGVGLEDIRSRSLWDSITQPIRTDGVPSSQVLTITTGLVKTFGTIEMAVVFVGIVSALFGAMSYYNVVWNMAKIKGRCHGKGEGCKKDMMTLQMAVDDVNVPGAGGMKSLWDPVAKGTMGWLVADILLSSLFL
jgi:hypothetical protein